MFTDAAATVAGQQIAIIAFFEWRRSLGLEEAVAATSILTVLQAIVFVAGVAVVAFFKTTDAIGRSRVAVRVDGAGGPWDGDLR